MWEESVEQFAWPQTTLACVNRKNPIHHASSSSEFSQIGGVSLRYSQESQTYVIDGRRKIEETKNHARSNIQSHYRWVRQDLPPQPNNNYKKKKMQVSSPQSKHSQLEENVLLSGATIDQKSFESLLRKKECKGNG